LFDPAAPEGKRFSEPLAPATQKRLYHSGVLLLETGQVLTMGSENDNVKNPPEASCHPITNNAFGPECTSPFNYKLERFNPPYLFQKNERIEILDAPLRLTPRSIFKVVLKDAKKAARVTFVRYSTSTHSTNTDQRLVELVIRGRTAKELYIEAPRNSAIAPSGNWFLFVLDELGVPSVAKTISLRVGAPNITEIPDEAIRGLNVAQTNSNNAGIIAGAVVGCILFISALLAGIFYYRRRKTANAAEAKETKDA
jgi:hypothetical protein